MDYIINDGELKKFSEVLSCAELTEFLDTHKLELVASVVSFDNPEILQTIIPDIGNIDKYRGKNIKIYLEIIKE